MQNLAFITGLTKWSLALALCLAAGVGPSFAENAGAQTQPAEVSSTQKGEPVTTRKTEGEFVVSAQMPVEGVGKWDLWSAMPVTLDEAGKFLYVPRETRTQVIDVETGKVEAEIKG